MKISPRVRHLCLLLSLPASLSWAVPAQALSATALKPPAGSNDNANPPPTSNVMGAAHSGYDEQIASDFAELSTIYLGVVRDGQAAPRP